MYLTAYTRPSLPTATNSYGTQSEDAPFQGYGPSTTSNKINNLKTKKMSDRSGRARVSRSKHISGSEYGTLDGYETSNTLEHTDYLVNNNSNDEVNGGGTASTIDTSE